MKIGFLLWTLLLPGCILAQNLIVNGDFETNAPAYDCNVIPDGWQSGGVQWTKLDQPSHWIDISDCGYGNGHWLEQSVSTMPGRRYQLSFDVGAPQYYNGAVDLYINGVYMGNFAEPATQRNLLIWGHFSLPYAATTTETIIRFVCASDGGSLVNVVGMDNVVFTILPSAVLPQNDTLCKGDTLTLAATSWSNCYWSSNRLGTDTLSTDSNLHVFPLQDTWYYAIAKAYVDSVHVRVISIPEFYLAADTIKCFHDLLRLSPVTTNPYQWSWNNTPGPREYTTRLAGTYTLVATDWHCSSTKKVTVHNLPALYPLGTDTALCFETGQSLVLTSIPAMTYLWEPGGEITRQIIITSAGHYSLTITDSIGCPHLDTLVVTDICDYPVYIPNAFSPGGHDNLNNLFAIDVPNAREYELTVYNRWGERIFYTDRLGGGWDGTFNGQPCPADVYMYLFRCRQVTLDNIRVVNRSGTFHLLR